MLDPTTDPHPGKIDLTQKHQAHPENLETPTLTQLFELPKFSQLTHFPGWAAHYASADKGGALVINDVENYMNEANRQVSNGEP